jgi:hypothetical protein
VLGALLLALHRAELQVEIDFGQGVGAKILGALASQWCSEYSVRT